MPPTLLVYTKWWGIYSMEVVSEAKVATAFLVLSPTEATIPEETASGKFHSLPLASLAPLQIVSPLLTPPFLSPAADYAMDKTIAASLHITESVQPLLAWTSRGIKESVP